MQLNKKMIFDIGMHKGEDTAYYLNEGYNVIAIDANPALVSFCIKRFEEAIKAKRLIVLNAGIGNEAEVLPFYINLHSAEWSSFDKKNGTRGNTDFETINIKCISTKSLFEQYGIPFFLKIDIEGNDSLCLNDIPDEVDKPVYVSCEAAQIEWLDILKNKGYKKFKLINQADGFNPINIKKEKAWYYPAYRRISDKIEKRTRKIFPYRFESSSSGPFAEKTKGEWKSFEEIRELYLEYHQGELNIPLNNVSWFDFHATL